jgi:putative phosphoesterase
MSSPLSSQQCRTDTSYCRFGCEKLSKLLRTFESPLQGVLENQDIEYVHKMRVASRRMRAAMPLFQSCCPRKKFKKWLREIRNVTRLLGEARDFDVQIAFIKAYIGKINSPSEISGIEALHKSHQDRRVALQATVANGLIELQGSGILDEMSKFLEETSESLGYAPIDASVLEKAYWQISPRIDDFLALEKCVHEENAILKHHEMRIKAKRLRYTMEVFASLYENALSEEIDAIKNFQDVLGEMHDCEVWIDYLPKFIAESKARQIAELMPDQENALLGFLTYIKDAKSNHYKQFVQMWDEKKAANFFGKIREKARTGSSLGENKMKQVLSNPTVKLAVLADVHANLHALETVIQDAETRGAEMFLNAGDAVGFGAFPNEVLELLLLRKAISVVGNFDLEVIKKDEKAKGAKKTALDFTRKELAESCASYILCLPFEVSLDVAGKSLFMVHGSPESIEEHIYHDTPVVRLKELAENVHADLIIVGHSHEQFHRKLNGVSFLNPGSVGRPGDGKPQAAYAMLSFNPFRIELIRLDYDVETAADALRQKGLPESFAQMLLRGLSLDDVTKEDEEKKDYMVQNCEELEKACQEVSEKLGQDIEHCMQVRSLALSLFDGLKPLHNLGDRERCWLDCAAILHDIGLSKGTGSHNKLSMKLILNDTTLPITSEERRIVASITRYHRKGFPKRKHYNLATFNPSKIKRVAQLSSILRMADGLDYSHGSVVKAVNVNVGLTRVFVEYVAASESTMEEQAFNKKKDLFEKVFKKKLVLAWKQQ